ncbi:MAG: TatD family hydrolase [Clostridia bacterium]|nr:TatD family hydrolase [Clostridia bacterium]
MLQYGIHPSDIADNKEQIDEQINQIKELVKSNKKVVGIGEIGLDYYWHNDNKELQKYAFTKQINLANELNLPISIHTRDAIDDTINILKNEVKIKSSGVLHCCPFNRELVKHGLDAGLYIAFGGTCTFKNSKNADEIINMVPLEKILIETDSPYLAPDPVRGTRNDSRNLIYVIKKIANVRELTVEEVAKITYNNAKELFKI